VSFFYTANLSKLLEPSPNALVIRWSHTILMTKFTLNSNNGLKFCVRQHGQRFLLWGRQCTDREGHVIKAAVRSDASAVYVSKTEFTIRP
jgi:hypothetical protein